MSVCAACGFGLDFGKSQCRSCGAWNPVEAVAIGGISKRQITTLDKIEAKSLERVAIGSPWDAVFGGGVVPTSSTLIGGPPGGGKALAVSTPIPTATGWKSMGELAPGDVLFDEQGRRCRVLTCSPVMRDHPCYRVAFSDGEIIIADAEHLWHTFTKAERAAARARTPEWRASRRARRPSRGVGIHVYTQAYYSKLARFRGTTVSVTGAVRTTSEIAATLRAGMHANHSVAYTQPLDLPEQELPIPPYTLGVWLGDGTTAEGHFTGDDPAVARRVRADGYVVRKYVYGERTPRRVVPGLRTQLRRAGLLGYKHIPAIYLRASFAQRLELLRGLMDTDGDCTPTGCCSFNTTSPQLRDDVGELLATLGIRAHIIEKKATLKGRVIGKCWRYCFASMLQVFHLRRKASRQRPPTRGLDRRRYIVAVDPVPSTPVRCIGVDSPSKLYLAGRGMVPTHNTTAFLQILSKFAEITGKKAYYISAEQGPGDLRITADRLQIPNIASFNVLAEIGGGAEIDEGLLKEQPPAAMICDSISALVGKDVHAAIVIARRYKLYAIKYKAPAFLVCHMTKEHDFAGLLALQHEVDTLITIFPDDDGSRTIKPWKNRYGPTHGEFRVIMTDRGLVAPPEPPSSDGDEEGSRAPVDEGDEDEPSSERRPTKRRPDPVKTALKAIKKDVKATLRLVRGEKGAKKKETAAPSTDGGDADQLRTNAPRIVRGDSRSTKSAPRPARGDVGLARTRASLTAGDDGSRYDQASRSARDDRRSSGRGRASSLADGDKPTELHRGPLHAKLAEIASKLHRRGRASSTAGDDTDAVVEVKRRHGPRVATGAVGSGASRDRTASTDYAEHCARANAIAGEALKRPRTAMPRTEQAKRAARARQKRRAAEVTSPVRASRPRGKKKARRKETR